MRIRISKESSSGGDAYSKVKVNKAVASDATNVGGPRKVAGPNESESDTSYRSMAVRIKLKKGSRTGELKGGY